MKRTIVRLRFHRSLGFALTAAVALVACAVTPNAPLDTTDPRAPDDPHRKADGGTQESYVAPSLPEASTPPARSVQGTPDPGGNTRTPHGPGIISSGSWAGGVVSAPVGAPQPLPGSPLDGITTLPLLPPPPGFVTTPSTYQQHVHYVGSDNHVHELFYTNQWRSSTT